MTTYNGKCSLNNASQMQINEALNLPGEYVGEIANHGIERDSSGRSVFFLDVLLVFWGHLNMGCEISPIRQLRILFDGTVSIGGRRPSRIPAKVHTAIQQLCANQFDHVADSRSLIGSRLICKCRHVENEDGVTERWRIVSGDDPIEIDQDPHVISKRALAAMKAQAANPNKVQKARAPWHSFGIAEY